MTGREIPRILRCPQITTDTVARIPYAKYFYTAYENIPHMNQAKAVGVSVGVLATPAIAVNQIYSVVPGVTSVVDFNGIGLGLLLVVPGAAAAARYLLGT